MSLLRTGLFASFPLTREKRIDMRKVYRSHRVYFRYIGLDDSHSKQIARLAVDRDLWFFMANHYLSEAADLLGAPQFQPWWRGDDA